MPTTVHNKTSEEIKIIDYYLTGVGGYPGNIKYQIPAGGKMRIWSSEFLAALIEQMETQQIKVTINEVTKTVLLYENFEVNEEVILEMHDGSMSVGYLPKTPKTRTTLAERIRRLFPFYRSGFNTESPAIPQV